MTDQDDIRIILHNAKAGRAAEHINIVRDNMDAMTVLCGAASGEFGVALPSSGAKWEFATLYRLKDDTAPSWPSLPADTTDQSTALRISGEAITGRMRSIASPDLQGAERMIFVVMTNPTRGNEEEYNRWYTEQHLPDVLAVDGFVAAQRFKIVNAGNPWQYLAIYEIDAKNANAALAELNAKVEVGEIPISSALDGTDPYAVTYKVEVVLAPPANRQVEKLVV